MSVESENRILLKAPPPERPKNPSITLRNSKYNKKADFDETHVDGESKKRSSSPANNIILRLLSADRAAVAQLDFFVPSHSIHCHAGGATKGKDSWRHPLRSLLKWAQTLLHAEFAAGPVESERCTALEHVGATMFLVAKELFHRLNF